MAARSARKKAPAKASKASKATKAAKGGKSSRTRTPARKSAPKGTLEVLDAGAPGFEKAFSRLCDRLGAGGDEVEKGARRIVERVRDEGDDALLGFVHEYDGAKLTAETLEVTREEWERAIEAVDPADRAALGKATMRVREFHRKRVPSSWEIKEEGGGFMGQRVRPLDRVGLYVPGGKATYPSSVIMNAVPASVVEVPEIVMTTPPRPDGSLSPNVLMAARLAGVHRIFKMGGAHAVAALAYGTETVPRVDKIVGPGNAWVSAAKRMVFGRVDIDGEAGPTEVAVVADGSANPAWVAADLISQAEHEEQAQAVLFTSLRGLVKKVQDQIAKQTEKASRRKVIEAALAGRGAVVLTRDLEQAYELANRYAPEHCVLAVDKPELGLKKISNAGAVFLGHYTPVAVGDYLAGPNHVLPTGGTARFFSPLGVDDFLKRTSFVRFDPPKLRELGLEVIRLADLEGLEAHGRSVELRLQKIRRARREREAAREADEE